MEFCWMGLQRRHLRFTGLEATQCYNTVTNYTIGETINSVKTGCKLLLVLYYTLLDSPTADAEFPAILPTKNSNGATEKVV